MKTILATAIVVLIGCSGSPPEDRPCLRCSEVLNRSQERFLCQSSWPVYERAPHGCRCAPSSPCETSCIRWCSGGDPEPGCAACTEAMCPDEVAACQDDQ